MIEMDDDGCDAKFKLLFDFIQQSKFHCAMTLGNMTLGMMTLGIMTLGIMTVSIKGLFAT